ncbi:A-kinase anchor protein 17B-like isoform X3 [Falco naumanni]|uniref:A-kinase anchor protein 17B-like isoform X3 n=1 Tax=Falco naumanni TaxID=148594 RepID=UPI001ADE6D82|nr:A-kinase anchor protein 17B-like isoform X3 [Falco naumanni]
MPEWEERKSLLAQRRVESVRLLTVLLNHVKDFVQLASQKVDPSLGVRKDNSFPETALKGTHQELINPHYLTHKELKRKEEFKCPLTRKSSSLCSEEGDASNYHASTCHIVRTILSDPSTAPSSDGLPGRDAHNSFGCGSLLITVTQDCRVIESLDGRDFPALNVVHTQTVSDEDGCKKPKVYETDEFIHYLLNYYQTPRYARVCLEPKSTVNKSWWKRVVSDDDSGFDICLSNKHGERFRGASPLQNLNRRNCSSDEMDSCMQLESLRKIQRKYKKMFHKKVKFKTLHRTMAAPGVTPHDGSQLQGTIQSTGDDKKLMFRRDVDADVRGCSLFPLEIIQTNPCSDTFCGAEPRRGC